MFYALSKVKDLSDSILMFAALSPCWFNTSFGEEYYEQNEFALRDLGIVAYNGPTW